MQLPGIFLLCLFASAALAFAVPEAWQAASHNIGISGSLLGRNACGFEAKEPSEGDMFAHAGMRAVSLVPLIDNVTSDLSSPSLVWSWAADAPPYASFRLPGTTECPGGEIVLFNRSEISFYDAKMAYKYGNKTKEKALSGTGPNPVPLDLNTSSLNEADFSQLHANLTVKLSAKAGVGYSFRKRELYHKCEYYENATVCYCAEKFTTGRKNYEKEIGGERYFLVEAGPVQEFWLNPPLQKRLDGDSDGKVLFFSRRMPGKITATVNGREIASSSPYSFETTNGSCGEKLVKSKWNPSSMNSKINMSNETVAPNQLVEKNASYLPIYLEFGWRESAGGRQMLLEYEDWFSNKMNFTRNFSVRKPAPFTANESAGSLAIRAGDDKTSPAAYPSQEKAGVLPDIVPLAALLALPLAFGAIGILRWMRKIVP